MTADDDLLERARAGDPAAFEALVRAHDEQMRRLAHRMTGSRSAMDDVLQDAYVKAFRALPRFRGDARFSTWLHRIVATTCIDHQRTRQRRSRLEDLDTPPELTLVPGGRFDDTGDAATRHLDLRRALAAIDPDQRAAFLLVEGEGLSYAEAGEVLGVAEGTVSSRLTRARKALRDLLATDEPRSEGGAR